MRNLLKSGSDSKTPGCNHCRRLLSWITVCVLLIGGLLSAEAVDNSQSYDFRVTVNGAEKIIVEPGDTITLVLSLSRTDTDDELMNIYSVSSVLRFHSRILELKDLQTGSGISSTVTKRSGSLEGWTDITLNYLAPSMGGVRWENRIALATLTLKATDYGASLVQMRRGSFSIYSGMDSYSTELGKAVVLVQKDSSVIQDELAVENYTEIPGSSNPAEITFADNWAMFTVKSDRPCSVMLIKTDGSIETLKELEGEESHSYFAEGAVEEDRIGVALKGDVNLDGEVDLTDSAMVKASYLGRLSLSDLQAAAANVTGSGEIGLADAAVIKAVYLGKYGIPW